MPHDGACEFSTYLTLYPIMFYGIYLHDNYFDTHREKGRDLTQSYDKSPYTTRNVKRAKWQQKQHHKKFDYTEVADRLRT